MTDPSILALHDRLTRGLPLSDDARARLAAWYAAQDATESTALTGAVTPLDRAELQRLIDSSLSQMLATLHQIQELSRQNAELRAAIAALQQRLSSA